MEPHPLIVIVGETASGKSDLALQIAKEFSGEIICADSRTIYRGMDIGTAKPSSQDQAAIPHHLINVVEPGQRFSVVDFKQLALKAIENITSRGHFPIMAGGTGLYVDSILYDYQFRPVDLAKRQELEKLDNKQLREIATGLGFITEMLDFSNNRRLVRAIESGGVVQRSEKLRKKTLVIGLQLPREVLRRKIEIRVDNMLREGFVDEVQKLGKRYGWDSEAMKGTGYRAFAEYIKGDIDIETARQKFIKGDMDLARRQKTWFKRNKSIQWSDDPDKLFDIVREFIVLNSPRP